MPRFRMDEQNIIYLHHIPIYINLGLLFVLTKGGDNLSFKVKQQYS
ncbi:hypothetical protein [Desulfosporosinus shakirovi]|nr:hypothetical protein [Desulfosporosinus sp. SRJS8]MCB8815730.1 hypothetical protein [Desulfosporosinus sp. SRJS8]